MKPFEAVNTLKISELIESQIRKKIFSEQLLPGTKLPSENELATIFNTSRATVRNALSALESDRLIKVKQGVKGGAYIEELGGFPIVKHLTSLLESEKVTLQDLTKVRLIIEPEIARMAAIHRTADEIRNLGSAVKKQIDILRSKKRSIPINISFHRIIGMAARNLVLFYINDAIMNLLEYKLSKMKSNYKNKELMVKEHEDILRYIKDKNPEKAFDAMTKHILTVKKAMKTFDVKVG